MKRIFYILLAIFISFIFVSTAAGQCSNCNTNFPAGNHTTTSSTLTTVSTSIWGGDYSYYDVTAGETYTWTTCSSTAFDTQLTLFQGTGCAGTVLDYNDDDCGLQSTITWTATFTGTVTVLVSEYDCLDNSTPTTLQWSCTSCGGGGSGDPCPDYASTVSSPNEHCAGQTYYFEVQNTACNGNIYFDVVGNYGSEYASEITWEVTSNLTSNVVASGGPGTDGANINVPVGPIDPSVEGTVFTVTVYDSFGDGFNGTGGYVCIEQGGTEICGHVDGDFGAEGSTMFMPDIIISSATITISTPAGDVTETVSNCKNFRTPITINNSLFCTTTTVDLPWEIVCDDSGAVLASGTHAMTIYPNTPTDVSDIVDISYDAANCQWVTNWQNDCNLSHLGDVFDITPDPTAASDPCEAQNPETFTLQYNGLSGGLPCCNTAGPAAPVTYTGTQGTTDAVPANSPFGGTNNAAYLTIPSNGSGGSATLLTLTFDMAGYCFDHPAGDPTDFWVTIIVDGSVVYDTQYFDPTSSASVTLDETDIPGYDQNSTVEVYVYPNTFSSGGTNTTYVPGIGCGSIASGEWTASSFDLSLDVEFDEMAPTPISCAYNANVNKPCCDVTTVADQAETICSGEPFNLASWQSAVETPNPACIVYSSVTPVAGSVPPDNNFPDGMNGGGSTIVQTVSAYAYCDANGSGSVDAGDTYTLLSTYELTIDPEITPTFTLLGPYCVGDTPDALPGTSTEG
ncbi:MAG: hypothetical protein R6V52_03945, partial [Bacteroidales bacterium]